MAENPYRPPRSNVEPNDVEASAKGSKAEPKGLGGWLILVAIGLIVSIIRLSAFLLTNLIPIFSGGHWETLTSPGTTAYHPLWGPLIIFEITGNVLFILMAASLLFLFFTKSRWFPRTFIIYYVFNVAFVLADFFVGEFIPAVAAVKADTLKEVFRAVISAAIWIPYIIVSKRVKNTFLGGEQRVASPADAVAVDDRGR